MWWQNVECCNPPPGQWMHDSGQAEQTRVSIEVYLARVFGWIKTDGPSQRSRSPSAPVHTNRLVAQTSCDLTITVSQYIYRPDIFTMPSRSPLPSEILCFCSLNASDVAVYMIRNDLTRGSYFPAYAQWKIPRRCVVCSYLAPFSLLVRFFSAFRHYGGPVSSIADKLPWQAAWGINEC